MAAYLIVNTDIRDLAAYEPYKAAVPALIKKHGGEYLARGDEMQVLEGKWQPARVVLLRFPDLAAIRAFMDDPAYQPWKALRHRVAASDLVAVAGL
jgi:uncharacterized protein (DUF1330 family)